MFYFGKTEDPELIICKGPSTNTVLNNPDKLTVMELWVKGGYSTLNIKSS